MDEIEDLVHQFQTGTTEFWSNKVLRIIKLKDDTIEKKNFQIQADKHRYLQMEGQKRRLAEQIYQKDIEIRTLAESIKKIEDEFQKFKDSIKKKLVKSD